VKPSEPSAPRAVLDTQVLLRGGAGKTASLTGRIYDAWRAGRFVLLLSEPILEEIASVLRRPEVLQKLRLSPLEARALLALLRRRSVIVSPAIRITESRDPADDKFLECAVTGDAHYLVSADTDLLSLGQIQGIPIIPPLSFWQRLQAEVKESPEEGR
jgi:putative PIN family toxin of toxin-antitoxin system